MGHPPKAEAFGRSPGSRENPWALFGYFLSQQKVPPRRGGETRQKTFRTRQECEGPDWRVAVKRKRGCQDQTDKPQKEVLAPQRNQFPQAGMFKKRPYKPVLKDRQTKAQGSGASAGECRSSLVTGRGLSLRFYTKRKDSSAILSVVP